MATKKEKCLKCGKVLEQLPGKRKKKFCNSTCRSGSWLNANPDKRNKYRQQSIPDSKKKVSPSKKVEVKNLNELAKGVKPITSPKQKSNYAINSKGKDVKLTIETPASQKSAPASSYLLQRRKLKS